MTTDLIRFLTEFDTEDLTKVTATKLQGIIESLHNSAEDLTTAADELIDQLTEWIDAKGEERRDIGESLDDYVSAVIDGLMGLDQITSPAK